MGVMHKSAYPKKFADAFAQFGPVMRRWP